VIKRVGLLFLLLTFLGCGQTTLSELIPKNNTEKSRLEASLVEGILWTNFWEGHWSQKGYWDNNQIDVFTAKKSFKAMIVPRKGGIKKSEWIEVYVDELRSVFSFLKEDGFYILSGISDDWHSEDKVEDYYKLKKENSKNSKKIEFQIKDDYLNIIKKQIETPEKCERLTKMFNDVVFDQESLNFIKNDISTKSVKKLSVMIGTLWNDYPCVYYRIKYLDMFGWVLYNPDTGKVEGKYLYGRNVFADTRHWDNLVEKIDREGEKFIAVDGKLRCER
jgi:hypothetical protein